MERKDTKIAYLLFVSNYILCKSTLYHLIHVKELIAIKKCIKVTNVSIQIGNFLFDTVILPHKNNKAY